MTFLNWLDDYAVGVPQIDVEHRNLFELVNEFHDRAESGDPNGKSLNVLIRLVVHAEEHFLHEEAIMELNGYPHLERHRKLHAVLLVSISDFSKRFEENLIEWDLSMSSFLKFWLIEHIIFEDKDFHEFRLHRGA